MKLVDRLLTIIITATLTSAIWIVAGGSILEGMDDKAPQRTPIAADQPSG